VCQFHALLLLRARGRKGEEQGESGGRRRSVIMRESVKEESDRSDTMRTTFSRCNETALISAAASCPFAPRLALSKHDPLVPSPTKNCACTNSFSYEQGRERGKSRENQAARGGQCMSETEAKEESEVKRGIPGS
tara:strand:+ start:259 stop:663 length:405 start_codon:yes stop_codon:yes gene_type:complete